MKHPKVLLIISCGKSKAEELHYCRMQASKAYTGPMFQVVQKAQREGKWSSNHSLGIISAKYGFLRSDDYIEYYDLKMTKKIAEKHNSQVIREISKWNMEEKFDFIYVLMGKVYLKAVEGLETQIDTKIVIESMGGLGFGQQKLIRFLEKFSKNTMSLIDFMN
ncbi:MAG: peroxide stress protein YaaA [Candidatus Hodarchaeales archaeon]